MTLFALTYIWCILPCRIHGPICPDIYLVPFVWQTHNTFYPVCPDNHLVPFVLTSMQLLLFWQTYDLFTDYNLTLLPDMMYEWCVNGLAIKDSCFNWVYYWGFNKVKLSKIMKWHGSFYCDRPLVPFSMCLHFKLFYPDRCMSLFKLTDMWIFYSKRHMPHFTRTHHAMILLPYIYILFYFTMTDT